MNQPLGAIQRPPMPGPMKALAVLTDLSVILIGGLLAVLVFINVVLHAFSKDMAWVTEFGELCMVWVTFLGGACAVLRGQHMTITEFIDKLSPGGRRWADFTVQMICLTVLLLALRYGFNLVQANWENELTVLGWPMSIHYMGMVVGTSLMCVFTAWDLFQILRGVSRETRYAMEAH